MRLVSFLDGSDVRPGAVVGEGLVDLTGDGGSVMELLRMSRSDLGQLVAEGTVLAGSRTLVAPLRPRSHLWAVGWNYVTHFEEGRGKRGDGTRPMPEHPAFFTKSPSCVLGPHDPLELDYALSRRWDYEAELAVVIGTGGRDIEEASALAHVAGYLLANDVTARDVQRQHGGQWSKGKSLDATCPLGPAVVTADEVADPQALTVRCLLNDQLRQQASTADMAFSVSRIISELSRGMTLVPGDVILTGTPAGVGYARDPQVFLQPGDTLVTEILDGDRLLGRLANEVVERQPHDRTGHRATDHEGASSESSRWASSEARR